MPEGLAQSMTDRELVNLLVYLTTLKKPVSIVGQYHVVGPLAESGDGPRINPASAVDLDASVDDGRGHKLSWRRMNANAEGLVDLTALASADSEERRDPLCLHADRLADGPEGPARPRHPGRSRRLAQRQARAALGLPGQGRAADRDRRTWPRGQGPS